jgi:undecaprenyl-diphosphatase
LDIDIPGTRGAGLTTGILVFVAGATVFAALASQLGEGHAMHCADGAIADALRTRVPQAVRDVFAALTHLADTATLTVLCVAVALVLCARRRFALASGWVVALAGNGLLNTTLKALFGRDRPLPADGAALVEGFSFPSGHSSGAVVAYGMLAYLGVRLLAPRWHLPAMAVAWALAALVGLSRLVLGVHYASDVIAGFASGSAWLALCVTGIELARWRGSNNRPGP